MSTLNPTITLTSAGHVSTLTPTLTLTSAGQVSGSGYTAQLCILYYILLYEDTRLAAPRGSRGAQALRCAAHTLTLTLTLTHPRYSAELLAELPLKFLLGRAEARQSSLEGLYPR